MKEKSIMEYTIKEAIRLGANHVSINLNNAEYKYYSCKNQKIQEVNASTSRKFSINLFAAGKYMSVSTKDLRKTSITDFLKKNLGIIKYLDGDENRMLPEAEYMNRKLTTIDNLYDSCFDTIDRKNKQDLAFAISRQIKKLSSKVFSNETYYYDKEDQNFYANSDGHFRENKQTKFYMGGQAYVKDGQKTQRSWFGTSATMYKNLDSVESVADTIVQKVLKKLGARPLQSGKYDLILENKITPSILGMVTKSLSGHLLDQKQSFLMNQKGKKIAPNFLTIASDPFIKEGLASSTFYGNGIPTEKITPIEKGVLKEFLISHYYSKRLKMKRTVPHLANVIIKGDHSLNSMLKNVKKGIYITGLIGGNFNSLSGDFSKGINGFLIENGLITIPINEMNYSGNLLATMNNINKIGNNYFLNSSWRSPSILIKGATISGKS